MRPSRTCVLLPFLACAAPAGEAGAPRFREVAGEVGFAGVPAYRVLLTDLDDDGWEDAVVQERGPGHDINPGGAARVFVNTADAKVPGGRRFVEVPGAIPLHADGAPANDAPPKGVFVVAGDVDGDGTTDLFRACYQELATHPKSPDTGERSAILRGVGKRGAPKFEVVPRSGVGEDGPVTTAGAAFLDFDRDGRLDLFVGNWYVHFGTNLVAHPDRLYRGDGTGKFEDVTERTGLLTVPEPGRAESSRPTYGVAHTDIDGDGWQDLLTSTYGRQWNRLWRWDPAAARFTDWGPRTGFDGDEDRSGKYPEWIRESKQLQDKRDEAPYRSNGNSFSAVPADFDADGDVDVFATEITHGWAGPSSDLTALLVNEGPKSEPPFRFRRVAGPFTRPRKDAKWWNQGDYTAAWADFDQDGLLDLALGSAAYPDDQRLRVWRQTAEHGFEDVTAAWGIDFRDCWHLAVADVNGDGAPDILASGIASKPSGRTAAATTLWLNAPSPKAHWVEIALEGAGGTAGPDGTPRGSANRAAIGARVHVTAGGRTQMREVLSATGHFGSAPPRTLHFGLGSATKVERVRVTWPDRTGTVQEFAGIAADRRWLIRQGDAKPASRE